MRIITQIVCQFSITTQALPLQKNKYTVHPVHFMKQMYIFQVCSRYSEISVLVYSLYMCTTSKHLGTKLAHFLVYNIIHTFKCTHSSKV